MNVFDYGKDVALVDRVRNSVQSLSVINIPPSAGRSPGGLVAILHGWGANGEDLASLVPFLNLPDYQFVVPDAPFPHPYSSIGRMWYAFDQQPSQNSDIQLATSQQIVKDWLQSLSTETNIPLERTILMGFSQGGAMTLDVGLNLPLAGLIVLSGYMHTIASIDEAEIVGFKLPILGFDRFSSQASIDPPPTGIEEKISNRQLSRTFPPVLAIHGRQDTVVPLSVARQAKDTLTTLGVGIEYHEFDMGHEIRPEVLPLIQNFVKTNT
ncbi:MAG: alpha/beta hydrolase [Cyanosarcina radialis HA8281-LM2]|jgi:phospholipase/carboxylesterase|nr:alpha/beta hydrolase [Cyanosarcina radialis HA8281-LM2]